MLCFHSQTLGHRFCAKGYPLVGIAVVILADKYWR